MNWELIQALSILFLAVTVAVATIMNLFEERSVQAQLIMIRARIGDLERKVFRK